MILVLIVVLLLVLSGGFHPALYQNYGPILPGGAGLILLILVILLLIGRL